jgi:signal transduction histidine kinase/ligand-binding sensor domain-containing protein
VAALLLSGRLSAYSTDALQRNAGIRPEKPLANLVLDQWTTAEGLISNNLTSVAQASDGFIWITSFNGAMRFDGERFQLFDKDNIPQLRTNGIYSIQEDSLGRLWFSTQSSGVLILENGVFRHLPALDTTRSIRIVRFDSKGRIWIGSSNGEVFYGSENGLAALACPQLDRELINDIAEGPDGRIYIATGGHGVLIYEEGEAQPFRWIDKNSGLPSNSVFDLLPWNGRMLLGSAGGLASWKEEQLEVFGETRYLEINQVISDRHGTLWLATEQGLGKLQPATGVLEMHGEEDGLPANQLSSLRFDNEGSLWLSSKKAGLLRAKDGNVTNYTRADGLSSNNINIIVENNGRLFIGADDGKIFTLFNNRISPYPLKTDLKKAGIRDICFDGPVMWIGSYRGLLRREGAREQLLNETNGLKNQDVRRIHLDRQGRLWIGTRSGGIAQMDRSGRLRHFDRSSGLESNYILAIEEAPDGTILVGTNGGGLSMIRPDGSVVTHHLEARSVGILIFNIHVESAGHCWISTNAGIYHFREGKFHKIEFDDRFKAETFFDLLIDNHGKAWLTSNIGILQASLGDMQANIDGELNRVPLKLFDRNDGMYNQECTGATRAMFDREGNLWVPTLGGAVTLHPDSIRINTVIPPVYITRFRTDFDEIIPGDQPIKVIPGYLRYAFRFTALSYYAPEKVQFRYRLDRIDREWIDAGNQRTAQYTNLPPGQYTFQVTASNNDGFWNERGTELHFRVMPALYQTKGFYILLFALAVFLVWLFYLLRFHQIRQRNRELLAMNQELDRFVYAVSHDLRAPLNSIMGLVEVARLEKTMEAKDHCLNLIEKSSGKLENFIVDLIELSRSRRLELQIGRIEVRTAVDAMLNDLKYLDREGKIRFEVAVRNGLLLENDPKRFELVLKNLISNAIKYHDLKKADPWVRISAEQNGDNGILLEVADNGKGIERSHIGRIFEMYFRASSDAKGSGLGLHLTQDAVKRMRGKIEVRSAFQEGTTFRVTLPSNPPARRKEVKE